MSRHVVFNEFVQYLYVTQSDVSEQKMTSHSFLHVPWLPNNPSVISSHNVLPSSISSLFDSLPVLYKGVPLPQLSLIIPS